MLDLDGVSQMWHDRHMSKIDWDLRDMAEGFRLHGETVPLSNDTARRAYVSALEHAAESIEAYADEAEQELELMQDMADYGMEAARRWGDAMLEMLSDLETTINRPGIGGARGYRVIFEVQTKIDIWKERINESK